MLVKSVGGVDTKTKWSTKNVLLATIIFLMPMGPLLLLAYFATKQLLKKYETKRKENKNAGTV